MTSNILLIILHTPSNILHTPIYVEVTYYTHQSMTSNILHTPIYVGVCIYIDQCVYT